MSSLFDPVCICNLRQHAEMNNKIQDHASDAHLLPRTLAPRPSMDNRCTTHRTYQPTEVVGSKGAGKSKSSERPMTIHPQLAQLKSIDSKLLGLNRSSAHNRMSQQPSRISDTSEVWKAFDSPLSARCPLRLTIGNARSIIANGKAPSCYHTTTSAQTRGPWMSGARRCTPTDTAADTQLWGNGEGRYPLEPTTWNNHPFALEHHAVSRHHVDPSTVVTLQNAFTNSTRRKLTVR